MSRSTKIARIAAGAALAALLAGCNTNHITESGYPTAYAERHPIRITEGQAVHEILIGTGRGTLTPVQRAELTSFAGSWRRRATGGVTIEVPAGTANERAARASVGEIRSVLTAVGVPAHGIIVQAYTPLPENTLAPVRVAYPTVKANAGPCGAWPDDLGVADWPLSIENRPYWNLGCANQKALAAMVDNPADLVQPRSETPPSATRRSTVIGKYNQGQDPSTRTENNIKDKIVSEVGQ
jgi:pilus assembly protein CpaD